MKRHKVILQHTTQRYEYTGNLVSLTIYLNDEEFENLKERMNYHRGTLALFFFTHGPYCTKHHKYLIWNTFESGEINIKIIN